MYRVDGGKLAGGGRGVVFLINKCVACRSCGVVLRPGCIALPHRCRRVIFLNYFVWLPICMNTNAQQSYIAPRNAAFMD